MYYYTTTIILIHILYHTYTYMPFFRLRHLMNTKGSIDTSNISDISDFFTVENVMNNLLYSYDNGLQSDFSDRAAL